MSQLSMSYSTIAFRFCNSFGAEARAHIFSPGRINLIGEHTD